MRYATIAVLVVLLVGGCTKGHSSGSTSEAPAFELKDLSGNKVSLAQFRGHPVMLDFWATWCPPCLVAGPYVEQFYERHKKDGLVTLGLNMDDNPSQVFAYAKKMNISYPILFAADSSAPADYGVQGFPSFVLIDAQGRAVQLFEGFGPGMPDAWESELQQILAKSH